jgi:PAS domain S-box-containing protein
MKSERLGLLMIAFSLLAIALVVGLLAGHQREARALQMRDQGVSLTRMLANIPFRQFVSERGRNSTLQALMKSQASLDFAYGAVVDADGRLVAQVAAPGARVPALKLSPAPAFWSGENRLQAPGSGRDIREFYGPVLENGQLMGFIRLGYFDSGYPLAMEQLPFLALLALPVFLLTPAFYFLVKRAVKPLASISRQMQDWLTAGSVRKNIAIDASGDLGAGVLEDFVQRFNGVMQASEQRVRELESEKASMQTLGSVIAYKKEKIDAVLHALPEGVMVLDESGIVTFANAKLEPLLGTETAAMIGRTPRDWCKNQELLAFLYRHQEQPANTYRAETMEFSPTPAHDRRISVSVTPLFSLKDSDRVLGTLAVVRDATGEYLARRSSEEFVANLSHELKAPLNTVVMYSELLEGEDGKSPEFRVEAVNAIHESADRMAGLIGNLLNISKIEMGSLSLHRQRVKMHDLLSDAFESITQQSKGSSLEFQLRLPAEIGLVAVDKDLLRIAVDNLLTNAIKYNRPGGTVTLSAEEDDDAIIVRVRDTGIGIPHEDQAHVFDKFFRAANDEVTERSGHGLGLYLAKQIVELHHGELTVSSEPGRGTEFTLLLKKMPLNS